MNRLPNLDSILFLWNLGIGDEQRFSLESRIFHSFSLIVVAALAVEIAINIFQAQFIPAAITVVILLLQATLYYLSRVKQQLKTAVLISSIEINLFTVVNYVFDAGLAGPNLVLFAISIFLVICVVNRSQWPIWIGINLLLVLVVANLEYYRSSFIRNNYNGRSDWFFDNILAYGIVVLLLYVGTSQILKNYNRQKELSDQRKRELELLNGEKDKLLSVLSHDLRTPLAFISQYFDLMGEIEFGTEERQAMERKLLQAINNTQELVVNVLDWVKTQREGHSVQLSDLELGRVIRQPIDLFRSIAAKKDIRVECSIDALIWVRADADMMQVVLRNLLNNAIKFSPPGSVIQVHASCDRNWCTITVADNGFGIPTDKQSRIFSLNVQSSSGTANEKGTGLGLALCKEFVQLQKGQLGFHSIPGKGSTFYIKIPCIAPDVPFSSSCSMESAIS